jgi:hypothetical protein
VRPLGPAGTRWGFCFAATYGVCAAEFLLRGDGGSGSLCGVQGGFAADDFLLGPGGAGADFAADSGHVVPLFRHGELRFEELS